MSNVSAELTLCLCHTVNMSFQLVNIIHTNLQIIFTTGTQGFKKKTISDISDLAFKNSEVSGYQTNIQSMVLCNLTYILWI